MDKTVAKAFAMIDTLSRSEGPRGVTDLARELGWTKSNAFRILGTLQQLGIVEKRSDTSEYTLSLKLWEIGTLIVSRLDLRRVSYPFMRQLADEANETVLLAGFETDHVVYLDQIECDRSVRTFTRIGGSAPVHCTATGKAILAYLEPDAVARVAKKLERFTANTLSTRAALEQELTSVRERGVASVRDEWEIGVSGVSSAIFDSRKYPIAALGISGPSERLSPSALKKFGVSVKKCAAQISERLGYI